MAIRQSQTTEKTHGFSESAVAASREALRAGGGRAAQFDHPELGGRGQWMPGMVMIAHMFDSALRARVGALFESLAREVPPSDARPAGDASLRYAQAPAPKPWFPAHLGAPAATGGQGELRYAYFPDSRRLVVELQGKATTYDTGEHLITGIAQAQSNDQGSVTFTSQRGTVRLADLARVD